MLEITDQDLLSRDRIESEFDRIQFSTYANATGARCFYSNKSGPTLGITIHTHGNEPSGLATLRWFREAEIASRLLRGQVIFVLNNLAATGDFLRARTPEDVKRSRFVDLNMNRLPADTLTSPSKQYEIRRAQELRPIWETFDFGFDIHTTTQDSKPMIIAPGEINHELFAGFPFDVIISNIGKVVRGKPVTDFYGQTAGAIPCVAIEAGSHANPASVGRAIECVLAILRNLDMLDDGKKQDARRPYDVYRVVDSVILSDQSYEMVKIFNDFEPIAQGQVLAKSDHGPDIMAKADGHTLLGPHQVRPFSYAEEAVFISMPKTVIEF